MMKGDKLFREVEENCFDAKLRLKEMNDTNVDVQVLSTIPVLFNYWAKPQDGLETARFFNDHIAQSCQLHPDRPLAPSRHFSPTESPHAQIPSHRAAHQTSKSV